MPEIGMFDPFGYAFAAHPEKAPRSSARNPPVLPEWVRTNQRSRVTACPSRRAGRGVVVADLRLGRLRSALTTPVASASF